MIAILDFSLLLLMKLLFFLSSLLHFWCNFFASFLYIPFYIYHSSRYRDRDNCRFFLPLKAKSQYRNIYCFCKAAKIILYFRGTNNIFADCIISATKHSNLFWRRAKKWSFLKILLSRKNILVYIDFYSLDPY